MRALLIPVQGPLEEIDLGAGVGASLDELQALVKGDVQALPMTPALGDRADRATAYVNEDGKYNPECKPNMRATDFMVPGVGLFWGDYISGPMVLCGFDPRTGENEDVPGEAVARARLIEREAG